MSKLESSGDVLGNHRSIQLSYGVDASTGQKTADFGESAHALPTPNNLADPQISTAFRVTAPLSARAVASELSRLRASSAECWAMRTVGAP